MMITTPALRRSLYTYVENRIREIPTDIWQTFPNAARVWKCSSQDDFLYGYYVGRIEEGALRYMLKATRSSMGPMMDGLEIREFLEERQSDILQAVRNRTKGSDSSNKNSSQNSQS